MAPGYFRGGDTERAEKALIDARAAAEQVHGRSSPLAAMPALLLAEILYEKNECDKAGEIVDDCEAEAEKQGCVDHLMAYYWTKNRLLLRKDGKQGEVRDTLRLGKALAERHGFIRLERCLEAEELRLSLADNELDEIKRFQKRLSGRVLERAQNPGSSTTTIDEIVAIAWCRGRCALGGQAEAIRVLKRWIAFVQSRGAVRSEVRLLILLSAALARDQKEVEASRFLREAVKKAARSRLVRSFIDEGKVIEFLLLRLFKDADNVSDPTTAFGLELLRIFAEERAGNERLNPSAGQEPGTSIVPEQLNARETEIIRLVSVGMSNREIGARLGLSEATVKWHLQGVFNKVHVRRRREAVLQARKFGIV
jgi:LuxR family maltose regulon positive regulatory protein